MKPDFETICFYFGFAFLCIAYLTLLPLPYPHLSGPAFLLGPGILFFSKNQAIMRQVSAPLPLTSPSHPPSSQISLSHTWSIKSSKIDGRTAFIHSIDYFHVKKGEQIIHQHSMLLIHPTLTLGSAHRHSLFGKSPIQKWKEINFSLSGIPLPNMDLLIFTFLFLNGFCPVIFADRIDNQWTGNWGTMTPFLPSIYPFFHYGTDMPFWRGRQTGDGMI